MGWSEKKTDVWGNEYVQHYDDAGKRHGWSELKQGIFGDRYVQHYDNGGNKVAWSDSDGDAVAEGCAPRACASEGSHGRLHDPSPGREGLSEGMAGAFAGQVVPSHGPRNERVDRFDASGGTKADPAATADAGMAAGAASSARAPLGHRLIIAAVLVAVMMSLLMIWTRASPGRFAHEATTAPVPAGR